MCNILGVGVAWESLFYDAKFFPWVNAFALIPSKPLGVLT